MVVELRRIPERRGLHAQRGKLPPPREKVHRTEINKSQSEGTTKWKHGLDGLLNTTARVFFPHSHDGRVLSEVTCEERNNCNTNSKLYKGRLAEDLAFITLVAPYTKTKILPLLQSSAEAAAKTCTGGSHGALCSQRWYKEKFEGSGSSEEEINALSIFSANLVAFGK